MPDVDVDIDVHQMAPGGLPAPIPRAIDDPAWVRERYVEAKELLAEVRELRARLPADLWERIDWFHSETFMDTCTTLGVDCACNLREASSRA